MGEHVQGWAVGDAVLYHGTLVYKLFSIVIFTRMTGSLYRPSGGFAEYAIQDCRCLMRFVPRTSRHTSHVIHYTSHVKRHTSHITHHTSHHTSHVSSELCWRILVFRPFMLRPRLVQVCEAFDTSHVSRYTSHLTPHPFASQAGHPTAVSTTS